MNTFKKLRNAALLLAMGAMVLTSCDDDDDDGGNTPPSSSATIFLEGTDAATGLPSTSIVDRGEGIV